MENQNKDQNQSSCSERRASGCGCTTAGSTQPQARGCCCGDNCRCGDSCACNCGSSCKC